MYSYGLPVFRGVTDLRIALFFYSLFTLSLFTLLFSYIFVFLSCFGTFGWWRGVFCVLERREWIWSFSYCLWSLRFTYGHFTVDLSIYLLLLPSSFVFWFPMLWRIRVDWWQWDGHGDGAGLRGSGIFRTWLRGRRRHAIIQVPLGWNGPRDCF